MDQLNNLIKCLQYIFDEGSFNAAENATVFRDPLQWNFGISYREKYDLAVSMCGHATGVIWGQCTISGMPAIVVVNDFDFMGGSLAVAETEMIINAFKTAIEQELPVVWCLASGGCRFFEGIQSLHCISAIINARNNLARAKIPLISIAMHPLYGGLNVCASLADIIIGEKDAHIGFTGINVIKSFEKYPLPPAFQTSEYVFSHGHLDSVAASEELKPQLSRILKILHVGRYEKNCASQNLPFVTNIPPVDPWKAVQYSRTEKMGINRLIELIFDDFYELHGDRNSADDTAIIGGIGSIENRTIVVIGHRNKIASDTGFPLSQQFCSSHPAGHRKALRLVQLADRFRIPVVTFIDTPGAYPDVRSEEEGMTRSIGELIAAMLELKAPSVGLLIGEGGSAGALPFTTVDKLIMCDHATYSVISPEGLASIVVRDVSKAPDAAAALKLTSADMFKANIIDYIIETKDTIELVALSIRNGIIQCISQVESEGIDSEKRIRISL
jgi:acetyl-CoA carboxylase carboxyl transferase subunit beta